MSFKCDSDYARNKNTPDIVYYFNDKEEYRLHKEDNRILLKHSALVDSKFVTDVSDTDISIQDFDRIKQESDENYHLTDNADVVEAIHRRFFGESVEIAASVEYSPENIHIQIEEAEEKRLHPNPRNMQNAIAILDSCLNETQKRRFIQFTFGNMSCREIAKLEGVAHTTVSRGIAVTQRRIRKYLAANPDICS